MKLYPFIEVLKLWRRKAIGFCFFLWTGVIPLAVNAAQPPTNSPPHWLSLAEVKQKWAEVPLDALERESAGGDLTARHYLGYCYAEGFRFEQNSALGISNYERAGKAGYLPSWNNLGLLYQQGKVVKQDLAKAIYYYHLAADPGLPQARANLGYVYRDGVGVERDAQAGLKWFQLAAAQGHAGAMVEIGRAYRFGDGVPQDLDAAETWFLKAAEKGDRLSQLNLGLLYDEQGRAEKAFSCFRQAAEAGEPEAMISLYRAYWDGKAVAADHAEAVKWLTKAAEAGNAHAECLLGYYFENPGWETDGDRLVRLPPPNLPEAIRWYRRSAGQGWAGGQYYLGLCYVAGSGVEQDEEHGLELVRQAADQNHVYAEIELASLYAKGIGTPRNDEDRPIELLQRVTMSDPHDNYYKIHDAYDSLVFRYERGVGTERDIFTAVQWYCRAALAGIEGYSIEDKIERGPGKPGFSVTYRGDAGRRLLQIAWPDIGGSEHFLAALSQYLQAARSKGHDGLLQIGEKYVTGEDAPQSAAKAWLWFSLAAANGAPGAEAKILAVEKSMTDMELKDAKRLLPGWVKDFNSVTAWLRGAGAFEIRWPSQAVRDR